MCHYSLNWAPDERPDRQEMSQAVTESLEVLGLEKHQALVVAHNDTPHRHVHVVVIRVDPETGKAASLDRNHVHLSRWAQEYEAVRGVVRCLRRFANNERRGRGERVQDRVSVPTARHRRTWLNPHRENSSPDAGKRTPRTLAEHQRQGLATALASECRPRVPLPVLGPGVRFRIAIGALRQ